jgi:hypothetical protein
MQREADVEDCGHIRLGGYAFPPVSFSGTFAHGDVLFAMSKGMGSFAFSL